MAGKYNENETLFIREQLNLHGEYVVDQLADKITELKLRDTDALIDSLNYRTKMQGNNPVLEISFFGYGRAVEIRFYQMRKNRDAFSSDRDVWANKEKNRKSKKANWYARTAYGSTNRLISMLATEYTEHERLRLKSILDNQKIKLS